jgi:septum site-determining protein MinD
MVKRGDMMNIDDVIEILAIKLLGVVPDDETIIVSTNKGEPAVLDQSSKAGEAYRNIVRRLEGEDVPFMSLSPEETFFSKLKRLVGIRSK